ncbi:MAG: UDP-N-acetylmuramate dehydrogenase [Candidatus Magasanikbacteria bacterium]|nr:UDP-N-acetylmuramate dehydrogenase [Candidatus Magasanikbacteria bacterium]
MEELYSKLKEFGDVKINESLAKHVTFKIGGPAKLFITINKTENLVQLLNYLEGQGVEYFIVAGGSNLLMNDNGFDGLVIKISTNQQPKLIPQGSGFEIEVDAGVMLGAVVNVAAKNSLAGMSWAIGIPGTFGGAIRGNAGAMGKEIVSVLRWVDVWRNGEVVRLKPEECGFSYRNSNFKHNKDVILRGCVYLEPGDRQEIMEKMQANLKQRKHTPYPSAGSFFKNIKMHKWTGDTKELPELFLQRGTVPVGWITETLGLRGLSIGGAKIAEEHGNYVINYDKATQADVLALVEEIKTRVYNKFGVELEPEVHIVK